MGSLNLSFIAPKALFTMRSIAEHMTSYMPPQDLPYYLLCQLTHEPAASQRGLAQRFDVSLGKVNYCLRVVRFIRLPLPLLLECAAPGEPVPYGRG